MILLVFAGGGWRLAQAQEPCEQEALQLTPAQMQCAPNVPIDRSTFHPTPLMDGGNYNNHKLKYPDPDTGSEIVSLYGNHGQDEQGDSMAQAHYAAGMNEAASIVPRCLDGTTNCPASQRRIVFLFIGFSNCDIEVCGSKTDAWADPGINYKGLPGQGCATTCNNPGNPDGNPFFNNPNDGQTPESLLYSIYNNQSHRNPLVPWLDAP
jgi:hypothetical protein